MTFFRVLGAGFSRGFNALRPGQFRQFWSVSTKCPDLSNPSAEKNVANDTRHCRLSCAGIAREYQVQTNDIASHPISVRRRSASTRLINPTHLRLLHRSQAH